MVRSLLWEEKVNIFLRLLGFGGGQYIIRHRDGKVFERRRGGSFISNDGELLDSLTADDVVWEELDGYTLSDERPKSEGIPVGDFAEVASVDRVTI